MILRPPALALPPQFVPVSSAARRAARLSASTGNRIAFATGVSRTSFTLMAWVYLAADRNTYNGILMLKKNNALDDTGLYTLQLDGDGTTLALYAAPDPLAAASYVVSSSSLSVGAWTHLALVGDATNLKGYLNGTLLNVTATHQTFTPANFLVGESGAASGEEFNGRFASVKAWDSALTVPEILLERSSYYPRKTGGLQLWAPLDRLNDYSDRSGNNRHGSATGTVTLEEGPLLIQPDVARHRRRAAFAAGGFQTIAVGQVTETDTAQPLTWAPKRRLVNLASETDSAQPLTRVKRRALGQPSETATAQPIARLKRRTLGQPAETDAAQPVTRAKRRAVAQASETDLAQPVTFAGAKTIAVAQAVETDIAQPIARSKRRAIAQVTETDSAQPVTRVKRRVVGQVAETDLAQAVARAKRRAVTQATETDLAQPVSLPGVKLVAVGQTVETDAAQPVTAAKRRAIGQAAETDTAQPVTRVKVRGVSLALEIDLAQPVAWAPKRRVVAQVLEVDSALVISVVSAGVFVPVGGSRDRLGSRQVAAVPGRIGGAEVSAVVGRIGGATVRGSSRRIGSTKP